MNEDPQAAVEEQDILVTKEPNNPAHYVNRAFAYTQLGDFERALEDYGRACELDPENEHIYHLRGCFYMDRQELELSLQDLNRVLELSDEFDDARLRRAAILLRLRRQDEALEDYEKLIAKYPDHPYAYTGRAWAHQMKGNEEAAEADVDRLVEMAPENALEATIQSLQAKAAHLQIQEQYDEAMQVAEEIIAMAPDQDIGYRMRGGIRWYSEQHVEACEDYSRLLEQESDDPDLLSTRGQVYAEMGEWNAALDDLNAAIELARASGLHQLLAFTLNGRAFTLAGLDRMDDSTRDYEESVRMCSTNSWAHYNRGIVMFQRGEHQQSIHCLEAALRLDGPPLPKRKRERAQALLARMDKESS